MTAIHRMMDANANRAREALRVMEDVARFVLNDESISNELKSLRHELHGGLSRLPAGVLEANRDTPGDVGTGMIGAGEGERQGTYDIAVAAGKRLSEAMRAMEEAAKSIDPVLAASLEAIRYRAYDAEHRLQLRLGSGRARQWRICVLLSELLCHHPWRDVLHAAIEGGADCIQVREKNLQGGDLARRVREVIDRARPHGVSVIVNDRVDVAMTTGADGVHLGTNDLSIRDARRIAGRTLLIGASTHNLDEAQRAVEAGADYCGVGMMFISSLKPDRQPEGPAYLRQFLEMYPHTPHLAIGGVTLENVGEIIDAGAQGVAVSSAACGSDDPAGIVRQLRARIEADATLASSPSSS